MCGNFTLQEVAPLNLNDSIVRLSPGVKHSVLRQVAEGLLSVRSGAGAPVVKAVYRGGKTHPCSSNITLREIIYCSIIIVLLWFVCVCI